MTRQQNTVLWIGLLLIVFTVAMKWSVISTVIFKGTSGTTSTSTSNVSSTAQNMIGAITFTPLSAQATATQATAV